MIYGTIFEEGCMPEMKREPKKILLVGGYGRVDLEGQLQRANWNVVNTVDGAAAVACAKHESFIAAVLISTTREMDLTETALNLKDIQPSMEIIFVLDRIADQEAILQTKAVLRAIPKSRIITTPELNSYLASQVEKPG
jgi:hypothetical protein